ncbi:protein starmaker-like [Gigantopelta aegis]|uniref:protein starmaker-like n=1 Tax=Gigantopelta aegis TaxID=1735272 RepID=UPI001B8874B9|nr:protein starmaker-like [Gigantopelta aegis]
MLSGDVYQNGQENREESENVTQERQSSSNQKQTQEENITAQSRVNSNQKDVKDMEPASIEKDVKDMEPASTEKDVTDMEPASTEKDVKDMEPASIQKDLNVKEFASIQKDLNDVEPTSNQRDVNDTTSGITLQQADESNSDEPNSRYTTSHQQDQQARAVGGTQEPGNTPRRSTSATMLQQADQLKCNDETEHYTPSDQRQCGTSEVTDTNDAKRKKSEESTTRSEVFSEANFFDDKDEKEVFDEVVEGRERYSDGSSDDDDSSFISVSLKLDDDTDSDDNGVPNEKDTEQERENKQTNNNSNKNNDEILNPENGIIKDRKTSPKARFTNSDELVDESINNGEKVCDKSFVEVTKRTSQTELESPKQNSEVNRLFANTITEDSEPGASDSDNTYCKSVDYDAQTLEQIDEISELEAITEESTDISSHTRNNMNPDEESHNQNEISATVDNSRTEFAEYSAHMLEESSNTEKIQSDKEHTSQTVESPRKDVDDEVCDKEKHRHESNSSTKAKPTSPQSDPLFVPGDCNAYQSGETKPCGLSEDETFLPVESGPPPESTAYDTPVPVEPSADSKENHSTADSNEFYMPRPQPPLPTNQMYTNRYTYRSYVAPTENYSDAEITSLPQSPHNTNKSEIEVLPVSHSSPGINQSERDVMHSPPNTNQSEIGRLYQRPLSPKWRPVLHILVQKKAVVIIQPLGLYQTACHKWPQLDHMATVLAMIRTGHKVKKM